MYARATFSFFWEGMKKDILTVLIECDSYQWNKGETVKTPRALKPFPIPPTLWKYTSMEFIVSLPKDGNKLVMIMVVD